MERWRTFLLFAAVAALAVSIAAVPAARAQATPFTSPDSQSSAGSMSKYQNDAQELVRAQTTLARLASRYRDLDGVTVTIGSTPDGRQAVSYYTRGVIVINRAHEYSIDVILEHEVWHIIDWRDNGRIDWGENLPPSDAANYTR